MNRTKTLMLLAGLTALLIWGGHALGGQKGLVMALFFAGVMNVGAYWFSDKIVLKMQKARLVSENDAPELHEIVRDLSIRAHLPMPKVYVVDQETPNAFATGRNPQNAAVAVTEGLLQILDKRELKGVLAHEIAHVKNRDTLVMTVAATIGGALSVLADLAMWGALFRGGHSSEGDEGHHPLAGLVGVVVAPIAAFLIQSAISRTREFMADEAGSSLTGDPLALASALAKIEKWSKKIPMETVSPATAHLFIISPLFGGGMGKLFSTHPPTAERIRRLEKLSQETPALIYS